MNNISELKMNFRRMLLNLYASPIILFLGSFIIMYFLGSIIPGLFSKSLILSGIGNQIWNLAPKAGLLLLGASLFLGMFRSLELWQWFKGSGGEECHNCGGMTKYYPNGRYGSYYKCRACGNNRADK